MGSKGVWGMQVIRWVSGYFNLTLMLLVANFANTK